MFFAFVADSRLPRTTCLTIARRRELTSMLELVYALMELGDARMKIKHRRKIFYQYRIVHFCFYLLVSCIYQNKLLFFFSFP